MTAQSKLVQQQQVLKWYTNWTRRRFRREMVSPQCLVSYLFDGGRFSYARKMVSLTGADGVSEWREAKPMLESGILERERERVGYVWTNGNKISALEQQPKQKSVPSSSQALYLEMISYTTIAGTIINVKRLFSLALLLTGHTLLFLSTHLTKLSLPRLPNLHMQCRDERP